MPKKLGKSSTRNSSNFLINKSVYSSFSDICLFLPPQNINTPTWTKIITWTWLWITLFLLHLVPFSTATFTPVCWGRGIACTGSGNVTTTTRDRTFAVRRPLSPYSVDYKIYINESQNVNKWSHGSNEVINTGGEKFRNNIVLKNGF